MQYQPPQLLQRDSSLRCIMNNAPEHMNNAPEHKGRLPTAATVPVPSTCVVSVYQSHPPHVGPIKSWKSGGMSALPAGHSAVRLSGMVMKLRYV